MTTDDEFGSESASARPGWSVGSRVTAALAVVTMVLLIVHVWWSIPVWVVWIVGGSALVAFAVAVMHRWRRSVDLEQDLF